MSNIISIYSPLFEIYFMGSPVFMLEMYFMYVQCFWRKDNFPMMYEGAGLYYVDEASPMSIIILFLHDLHFDNVRRQQESLLLGLLLREYGLKPLHTHPDVLERMYGTLPCYFDHV